MRSRRKRDRASAFGEAVNAAEHLKLKSGLSAIKRSEGGGQVEPSNAQLVLGSVDIDGDCCAAHPQASRWDYVVGYVRGTAAAAYFIDVHSAETSEVSTLEKKLQWLLDYLQRATQKKLAALPREIHWVASGRVNIPKTTPQYRYLNTTLRKRGLRGPIKHLTLI